MSGYGNGYGNGYRYGKGGGSGYGKGRGKGRGWHNNNQRQTSYDLPEYIATKSGKWEKGCDKMRMILNQEKLSALMKGEAEALILPTKTINRLRQLLESTPITTSDEEWQQYGISVTGNKVMQTENDIWTLAGYHITETFEERMQTQANLIQTQTQTMVAMAESQNKIVELLEKQNETLSKPAGLPVSPPRKKGRGKGRGN